MYVVVLMMMMVTASLCTKCITCTATIKHFVNNPFIKEGFKRSVDRNAVKTRPEFLLYIALRLGRTGPQKSIQYVFAAACATKLMGLQYVFGLLFHKI